MRVYKLIHIEMDWNCCYEEPRETIIGIFETKEEAVRLIPEGQHRHFDNSFFFSDAIEWYSIVVFTLGEVLCKPWEDEVELPE